MSVRKRVRIFPARIPSFRESALRRKFFTDAEGGECSPFRLGRVVSYCRRCIVVVFSCLFLCGSVRGRRSRRRVQSEAEGYLGGVYDERDEVCWVGECCGRDSAWKEVGCEGEDCLGVWWRHCV